MTRTAERMDSGQVAIAPTVGEVLHRIGDRLTDPYLTAQDRWVLRQFYRFLDGDTPEPDRRALRIRDM